MESQEQVFGLIAVAEEQQKAVQMALEGLKAERAEVTKERAGLSTIENDVRRVILATLPAVQKTTKEALREEVRESFAEHLKGVVKAAGEVEGKLSGAVAGFGWRWALLAGGAAAGGVAAVLLAAWVTVWWQRSQIKEVSARKAELMEEVVQLQANVTALEKKGGRIVMTTCGGRLCIEASSNQGPNAPQWTGAGWSHESGVQLVIPRGY